MAAVFCSRLPMRFRPVCLGRRVSRERSFEATSFGPTTSKVDPFGFIDENGVYRETGFVRAARDGGVFLTDELDAGHAGVVTGSTCCSGPLAAQPSAECSAGHATVLGASLVVSATRAKAIAEISNSISSGFRSDADENGGASVRCGSSGFLTAASDRPFMHR